MTLLLHMLYCNAYKIPFYFMSKGYKEGKQKTSSSLVEINVVDNSHTHTYTHTLEMLTKDVKLATWRMNNAKSHNAVIVLSLAKTWALISIRKMSLPCATIDVVYAYLSSLSPPPRPTVFLRETNKKE